MLRRRVLDDESDDAAENRQTASLASVVVVLVLLIVGLSLVRTLREKSAIEDCLMSGRRNCDMMLSVLR
jgi:hypothetical protein